MLNKERESKISSAFVIPFRLWLNSSGLWCFTIKPRLLGLVVQTWLVIWIQPSCYIDLREILAKSTTDAIITLDLLDLVMMIVLNFDP